MNFYVINIRDKNRPDYSRTYNEKASRQGVAVDRALTDFLRREGYHPQGRMAPTKATIEILVARS